jgi:ABC-type bacteriocin/lantibiotic exporter with double-glycine peptidase domain
MRRRYLVPEVIQSSVMDCGPAALKALFGGFDVYLSYGRLREACQTDVDGTSIDTIEVIAGQLGMHVTQLMLPADLILLDRSACLPAIIVVNRPDGGPHLVVLWRIHGPYLQVMDPAAGRIWMPRRRLLKSLYIHEQTVPIAVWDEWSGSDVFTSGLEHRMRALKIKGPLWCDRAHQDAALRLIGTLNEGGHVRRGGEAQNLLALCADHPKDIPREFWTRFDSTEDRNKVIVRGAILLTAGGPRVQPDGEDLPASLARVRNEPPVRAWDLVWEVLQEHGWKLPIVVGGVLLVMAFGTVLEAVLFRGLFDLGSHLHSTGERLAAVTAMSVFLATLLALDWPAAVCLSRLGRHLEIRLRTLLLRKVPLLSDRYFQSRLISDMAFRAHSLHLLRQFPDTAGHCLQSVASILITGGAIACFYPGSALLTSLAVVAACGVPMLLMRFMEERDLRFRELSASLGSFYLDSMLGSRAIRAHGAELTMRATHAAQLLPWAAAGLHRQVLFVGTDVGQMALSFAFSAALVYHAVGAASPAGLLLLTYWALSIPLLGQEVATSVRSLPAMRNTLLRFLEVIGSPTEGLDNGVTDDCVDTATVRAAPASRGVKVDIEDVSIVAGGHSVLEGVTLHAAPGEHIGIVGASGAGKSSLVGCLLGWNQPSSGSIRVDDLPLDSIRLARLRSETAWIDPQVHLFRSTLLDNLLYGNGKYAVRRAGESVALAELERLLERLPRGLQTQIGEGGALISGGEGQCVRTARACGRTGTRLAILDEPARGLGREQRRRMLAASRRHFSGATLFCITHDVGDTRDFDRVLVVEDGRVVEQGPPQVLYSTPGSRYFNLLEKERTVASELWAHPKWRRLRLFGGTLCEIPARGAMRQRGPV